MDPFRAHLLESTLSNLRISGVTLSELLLYVLHQYRDPSHPALRDVIDNAKSIPAALSYHPATVEYVTSWSRDYMCARFSRALQDLSDTDTGWHFGAMHTKPEQVRDFRFEEMAVRMHAIAPDLWSLVYTLLLGVDSHQEKPNPPFEDLGIPGMEDHAEVESDSDGEYWEVEDTEGMGEAENRSSAGDRDREEGHSDGKAGKKRRRRVSRGTFATIKTVVILSMLMQSRDSRCNALQSIVGIFLHSCNAPEKAIKVLSRIGISISLTSIHRAIYSLSKRSEYDILTLGRSMCNTFTFDNFDILLKVLVPSIDSAPRGLVHLTSGFLTRLEHGVSLEDLRCSHLIWNRSENNPHATDPRPFDPRATMDYIYLLHPEPDAVGELGLQRAGRFRSWIFARTLCQFGPAVFAQHTQQLHEPESVESIPIVKAHYVPLRAMDINQSTVSGNIQAIEEMFKQAGIGDPRRRETPDVVDLSEFMTIFFGDLGTYERVLSAIRRRSIERSPYNRLQSVTFRMGLFHLKMAAADTIWRLLVEPVAARRDDASFMKIAGRLRPNDSSRLVAGATFREQHELIAHVGTILRLDAWRVEVKKRTGYKSLEEWAETIPSPDAISDIADCLARDYAEGEGVDLYEFSMRSAGSHDEVRENTMRIQNYILVYEELSYAMNAGDIGRLETVVAKWVPLFRAAGKHKYGTQTLRFMHALYFIYPEGLRRAIRYNILVNPSGQPLAFRAADWLNEYLNCLTKVTYGGDGSNYTKDRVQEESPLVLIYRNSHANMERNFALPGLTSKHAEKNMKTTFADILQYVKSAHPNEYNAGRKSQYPIPDALTKGSVIIGLEGGKPPQAGEDGIIDVEGVQMEGENLVSRTGTEDDEPQLTADDLSVEGGLL